MATSTDHLYRALGVAPGATDAELRHAYRRLVQLHHPDHNGGSPESARRFAEVQDAYTRVLALRRASAAGHGAERASAEAASAASKSSQTQDDLDARIAAMERELREAREAQAAARVAAARAAAATAGPTGAAGAGSRRPTAEELGYVRTEDSLGAILDDAGEELGRRWGRSKGRSFVDRLTDLFADDDADAGGSDHAG